MKVEVWYAVDEDGTQCLYTEKPNRIKLNIPIISWEDEPIKIELDIQAMVINQ